MESRVCGNRPGKRGNQCRRRGKVTTACPRFGGKFRKIWLNGPGDGCRLEPGLGDGVGDEGGVRGRGKKEEPVRGRSIAFLEDIFYRQLFGGQFVFLVPDCPEEL